MQYALLSNGEIVVSGFAQDESDPTVLSNQTIQLPESGKVVIVGESPGDQFVVTVK